jgi:hypothetical protein
MHNGARTGLTAAESNSKTQSSPGGRAQAGSVGAQAGRTARDSPPSLPLDVLCRASCRLRFPLTGTTLAPSATAAGGAALKLR